MNNKHLDVKHGAIDNDQDMSNISSIPTRLKTTNRTNNITIIKKEYEGHGEIEQGIESHLLWCNTQHHQTSFLKLFPHLNNKIHVMFQTFFSFQHLGYSNFHLVQANFINLVFLAVFFYRTSQ